MIRSPATIPAEALGPPEMTFVIWTVSVNMLNITPIPSNVPANGSFVAANSLAGM